MAVILSTASAIKNNLNQQLLRFSKELSPFWQTQLNLCKFEIYTKIKIPENLYFIHISQALKQVDFHSSECFWA